MEQKGAEKKEATYELVEIPEEFGPLYEFVDDHKIKTYAFTQDDYNPWYFEDSPFGGRIGHASILANDLLQLFYTKYDPNTVVGLHTQEELWFHNPVFFGEQATLQGKYVDKYEKRGQGYVVMEAEARGEDGRLLISHRGGEIMRTHPASARSKKKSQEDAEAGDKSKDAGKNKGSKRVSGEYCEDLAPVKQAREDLQAGTPIAKLQKHITQEQMSVYSLVGKYYKNIHNNLDVAREAGLERPIVQGQQQVGYLTELLTRFFGPSWFTSGWEKIKFLNPVYAGETVTATGVVTGRKPENGKTRLELEVWIRNEQGEMSAAGWASAFVDDSGSR